MWLRPAELADAPAVLAVLLARDRADLGAPDHGLQGLLDLWRSGELDLPLDTIVAEDAAGIAGYAAVSRHGAMAVVAPDHQSRGIGERLLEWTQHRERARQQTVHRQWIAAENTAARALLRAAGYARVRGYVRMAWSPQQPLPAPAAPAGVAIRPVDIDGDAVALHALDAVSFASVPDYVPESLHEFRIEHLRGEQLDRAVSCVAARGGELVGFLLALRWEDLGVGFVDLLAVHPGHRRRGIASALLGTAFAGLAAAGLREAQLGVAADNPRAMTLYERVGMRPRFAFETWERPLNEDPPR
ncbi:MAG TPA: GNAT family N-acetyltransferase [Solirubrobacteraceae bacterium]|jgi:mycothiol synthase|nr:GNAT family N-acetyltransferase [Solirubrobacteraceae bacterium]